MPLASQVSRNGGVIGRLIVLESPLRLLISPLRRPVSPLGQLTGPMKLYWMIDAPGQSDQSSQAIGETTDQSSEPTDKANETVLDDKLESMNEDVNEMEPGCEIAPAETDEKEVSVISDRKSVSSDGKDDLVSQLPQDFIAPTAKKMDLHIPGEYQ